jgi:hypothetical protein
LITLHRIRRNTISNEKILETCYASKRKPSFPDSLCNQKSFDEDGYLSPMEIKAKVIENDYDYYSFSIINLIFSSIIFLEKNDNLFRKYQSILINNFLFIHIVVRIYLNRSIVVMVQLFKHPYRNAHANHHYHKVFQLHIQFQNFINHFPLLIILILMFPMIHHHRMKLKMIHLLV